MPIAAGLYYAYSEGGNQGAASTLQPPVILIHGAGSSHLGWPAALRRLPGCRVLALDLPGHGRSAEVGLQSLDATADRLVDFLEAIGLYQRFSWGIRWAARPRSAWRRAIPGT